MFRFEVFGPVMATPLSPKPQALNNTRMSAMGEKRVPHAVLHAIAWWQKRIHAGQIAESIGTRHEPKRQSHPVQLFSSSARSIAWETGA